jgi:hypothetical protein
MDNSGISVSIDRLASIGSVTATLEMSTLLDRYILATGGHEWTVLVYIDGASLHKLIVAMTQQGVDVVSLAAFYSDENSDLVKLIARSIK